MTKYLFTLIIILPFNCACFSQVNNDKTQLKRNSFYIEFGGNSGSYSINYDLIFYQKNNFKMAGRVGFAIIPTNTIPSIYPVELNAIHGKTRHNLEYGIGISPVIYFGNSSEKSSYVLLTRLGYRYQKPEGGLFLRLGFTPVIRKANKSLGFTPWGGLSIGKSF